MLITEISAALTSLKAAKDIAEVMIGLRDAAAFQEKRIELQSKISDAQSSIFAVNEERLALIQEVDALKKKIASMETWETEKQRYVLKQVSPGAFAQVLKETSAESEPPHWICAACYQDRKKPILQAHNSSSFGGSGMKTHWVCPSCKSKVDVTLRVMPEYA